MKIKTSRLDEKNMTRGITIGGTGSGFQAWTNIFYETKTSANSRTMLSLIKGRQNGVGVMTPTPFSSFTVFNNLHHR